jgi:hypothetical protein
MSRFLQIFHFALYIIFWTWFPLFYLLHRVGSFTWCLLQKETETHVCDQWFSYKPRFKVLYGGSGRQDEISYDGYFGWLLQDPALNMCRWSASLPVPEFEAHLWKLPYAKVPVLVASCCDLLSSPQSLSLCGVYMERDTFCLVEWDTFCWVIGLGWARVLC